MYYKPTLTKEDCKERIRRLRASLGDPQLNFNQLDAILAEIDYWRDKIDSGDFYHRPDYRQRLNYRPKWAE